MECDADVKISGACIAFANLRACREPHDHTYTHTHTHTKFEYESINYYAPRLEHCIVIRGAMS